MNIWDSREFWRGIVDREMLLSTGKMRDDKWWNRNRHIYGSELMHKAMKHLSGSDLVDGPIPQGTGGNASGFGGNAYSGSGGRLIGADKVTNNALTIRMESGWPVCEEHNLRIIGKLKPYRRPGYIEALRQYPDSIIYWLRCPEGHWCLEKQEIETVPEGFWLDRGNIKVGATLHMGDIPENDPRLRYEYLPTLDTIPCDNPENVLTEDFDRQENLERTVSQIVGCELSQERGRKVTDAQILGLYRRWNNLLPKDPGKREHWEALLNRKLKGNGLKRRVPV